MSSITREENELWTSYLIRRLEAEGITVTEEESNDGLRRVVFHAEGGLRIERVSITQEYFDGSGLTPRINAALKGANGQRHATLGDYELPVSLFHREHVHIDTDDYQGGLSFEFHPREETVVTSRVEEFTPTGALTMYINGVLVSDEEFPTTRKSHSIRPAEQVIDDLVQYAVDRLA